MIFVPDCARTCVNFVGIKNFGKEVEEDERNVCKAFPKGIPGSIDKPSSHLVPIEGQKNDITYKKRASESQTKKVLQFLKEVTKPSIKSNIRKALVGDCRKTLEEK